MTGGEEEVAVRAMQHPFRPDYEQEGSQTFRVSSRISINHGNVINQTIYSHAHEWESSWLASGRLPSFSILREKSSELNAVGVVVTANGIGDVQLSN